MTAPRLAAHMLAGALVRRVQGAGGFAMVAARGDPDAGALLIVAHDRETQLAAFERMADFAGGYRIERVGPPAPESLEELDAYARRRSSTDPDLWVIEVNIADAERFVAETIGAG